MNTKIVHALKMIDRAIELAGGHTPVYALFSGGHDSLVSTYITSLHPAFAGVIHIDTGTGIDETQQFVKDTCATNGWPLHIGQPFTTYPMLLVKYGFPGPDQHKFMYQYLKDRPLVAILKAIAPKRNVVLTTGVRKSESLRRMLDARFDAAHRIGNRIWCSPISEFSHDDVRHAMTLYNLSSNAVKSALGMSGECLCGAFAKNGERHLLSVFYPYIGERIAKWEALVRAAAEINHAILPHRCKWGTGSKGKHATDEQLILSPMCFNCSARHTES